MQAPSPPAPPDPYKTAAAQTQQNVSTAIANTVLQNANEDRPDGTVEWIQFGSYTIVDPSYDSEGNQVGTTNRIIPRWKKKVRMTTLGQQVYDKQMEIANDFNDMAIAQIGQIISAQSNAFTLDGVPARASTPSAPSLNGTAPTRPVIRKRIGATDLRAEKRDMQAAIYDRLQYQTQLTRDAKLTDLANQGISPGTPAYTRAMLEFDKTSTDQFIQAYIAAGAEQTRMFQMELQQGHYELAAQQQEVTQLYLAIEHTNKTALQTLQVLFQLADFANQNRDVAIKEKLLLRSQPINEISALMHGGQIKLPESPQFRPGHIADTPLGDYVYRSAALKMEGWKTQVQNQQQMMGGMMGLFGNLISMPMGGMGGMFGG